MHVLYVDINWENNMELNFKPYRRKPIIVEALELTDELHTLISGGTVSPRPFSDALVMIHIKNSYGSIKIGDYTVEAHTDTIGEGINHKHDYYFLINTLEDIDEKTLHRAEIGDYLVKGINDEIWAVKPKIFHETYEESYIGHNTSISTSKTKS